MVSGPADNQLNGKARLREFLDIYRSFADFKAIYQQK
jgi:hypothetical protein